MKCKHQHSGRGLLLTISTSVGKYLYAGELREKTHFMSRKTQSTDQGKMRNQPENASQAQLDQNKPMHPSKPAKDKPCPMGLGQGTPGQPKCKVWGRLEPRASRPTYQVGRPDPWAPPPHPSHVSPPHRSPRSVLEGLSTEGRRAARGSLLYI